MKWVVEGQKKMTIDCQGPMPGPTKSRPTKLLRRCKGKKKKSAECSDNENRVSKKGGGRISSRRRYSGDDGGVKNGKRGVKVKGEKGSTKKLSQQGEEGGRGGDLTEETNLMTFGSKEKQTLNLVNNHGWWDNHGKKKRRQTIHPGGLLF